jgi:hypothetical protein
MDKQIENLNSINRLQNIFKISIKYLDISDNLHLNLNNKKIYNIVDLIKYSSKDLLYIKKIGR